jgi:hypothetical protein
MSFPLANEIFQFTRFAFVSYVFRHKYSLIEFRNHEACLAAHLIYTELKEWVVPFGNRRIKGFSHLPEAYRSVTRPSSPAIA